MERRTPPLQARWVPSEVAFADGAGGVTSFGLVMRKMSIKGVTFECIPAEEWDEAITIDALLRLSWQILPFPRARDKRPRY